jgi:hypothetical protein
MTQLNLANNASYNFKAPTIAEHANKVIEVTFPTAKNLAVTPAASVELEIENQATLAAFAELDANVTLDAVMAAHVQVGSVLRVKAPCGATPYNITFGTGFANAPVLVGVASRTQIATFLFNGTAFEPVTLNLAPADVQAITAGATKEIAVTRPVTVVDFGVLGAAMTVTADVDAAVAPGALLHVKAKSDGTARDITLSTGFTAPVLAGVISKTKVQSFMWTGATFLPMGAALQID